MKTSTSFEYEIPATAYDNMELIDALADVDSGNQLAISRVCTLILGMEQKKALYDHVRREDGTVPVEAVTNEILEIISANNAGKNS